MERNFPNLVENSYKNSLNEYATTGDRLSWLVITENTVG